MSCSHAAASRKSASAPSTGARLRARAATTPWTCAQRRGRGSWMGAWANCPAHEASVFIRPRLDSRGGTFTDLACRLKTSCYTSGPSSGDAGWPQRGGARLNKEFCGFPPAGHGRLQEDSGELEATAATIVKFHITGMPERATAHVARRLAG